MFSHWVEVLTVGKLLLENIIPIWGSPSELHSDWGTNLTEQIIKPICDIWPIMPHFHCTHHPQSSGLVERTNDTIKMQLAKLPEPFNLSRPKALLLSLHNLRSMSFGKHQLSPFEIITGWPMRLDEKVYEPTSLQGDILHYCQGLSKTLKENEKLVANSFHSELPGDEDLKDHGLQPGNFGFLEKT